MKANISSCGLESVSEAGGPRQQSTHYKNLAFTVRLEVNNRLVNTGIYICCKNVFFGCFVDFFDMLMTSKWREYSVEFEET